MAKMQISIRNGFSDRTGKKPFNKTFQFDDLDERTRNCLASFARDLIEWLTGWHFYNENDLAIFLGESIFNEAYPYKKAPYLSDIANNIMQSIKENPINEVFDILEFLCNHAKDVQNFAYQHGYSHYNSDKNFYQEANAIFKDEFVGYSFVDNQIIRITDENEIAAVEEASCTPFEEVNEHIEKAVKLMKETGAKDYKKAIHECTLALEELGNKLNNTSGKTLTESLKSLEKKIKLHPTFWESAHRFYWYASDSQGIRHGNGKEDYKESFDEAKFALVQTSAFINLLISKSTTM